MSDHHDQNDHGHNHEPEPADPAARVAAIEHLLRERGIITEADIDRRLEALADQVGPLSGSRVVARAWVDPEFRARLLDDAKAAVAELGITLEAPVLAVIANTDEVHNVVVCTLCSCYPQSVLGLPPSWYKSAEYRSRVVREPRAVLEEMGLTVDADKEIRVWDSSADMRYLVLPERPSGTEGMTEDDLAALVTRDAMIGVAR